MSVEKEYNISCRVVYSGTNEAECGVKYVTLRVLSRKKRLAKREAKESAKREIREELPFLSKDIEAYIVDCYIVKKDI